MKRQISFLTVIPSPYQRQLFRQIVKAAEFEVRVFYYAARASDREWAAVDLDAHETILRGTTLRQIGSAAYLNPTILRTLRRAGDDLVVVSDYSIPTSQIAMRYLNTRHRPWIFWGEIPGLHERGTFGRWVRRRLQAPLGSASAIAAIGSGAVDAYGSLFPGKPVHNIPYFCDLEPFAAAAACRDRSEDDVNILFSGQLIHRKGVDLLLDAFVRAIDKVPSLRLLLLGSGPDRAALEGRLRPGLRERVTFLGHKDPIDIPRVFADADIFVLPSRHDGWGVVVNEALGAGLPIIASDAVGASRDLITHGENGIVVRRDSTDELVEALVRLGSSSEIRTAFAAASRKRAKNWGLDEGVRRWERLIELVLDRRQ